ncbi:MAG TPA: hypothetical protein VFW94_24075 [Candidatus Acidoferrales bacterium]|nr:hypothetical protein [Candidatus Acidoferrales bacterium]
MEIKLSTEEYETLLLMMGYATAAAFESDKKLAYSFLKVANAVNRNNPSWTPYEIPEGM